MVHGSAVILIHLARLHLDAVAASVTVSRLHKHYGLQVVTLHDNQLTGTIPTSWVKQGLMRQLDLSDNIGLT